MLTGLNLFGIWRWLGRQARIEEGATAAAEASEQARRVRYAFPGFAASQGTRSRMGRASCSVPAWMQWLAARAVSFTMSWLPKAALPEWGRHFARMAVGSASMQGTGQARSLGRRGFEGFGDREGPMAGPLIVTAELRPADFAWLNDLRRRHYPAERNRVPAHLTMFHALPPSAEYEIRQLLANDVEQRLRRAHGSAGVMNLGGGVALRIASEDLDTIRARDRRAASRASDRAGLAPAGQRTSRSRTRSRLGRRER